MPNEATVQDIEDCYFESAKIGVKAIAIYRDGSKASQPLSASSDEGDSDESDPEVNKILEEEAMLVQGNFAPLAPVQQARMLELIDLDSYYLKEEKVGRKKLELLDIKFT